MHVLATDRVVMRELADADAPFLVDLFNQPSFVQFIGDRGIRTHADAIAYLHSSPQQSYRQHGFGLWRTELTATGAAIGVTGLQQRPFLDDPDLGFALLPGFWGQGLALEAAAGVVQYAREVLHLPRVLAIVKSDNERSLRLLGKLGMRFQRMVRPSAAEAEIELFTTDPVRC